MARVSLGLVGSVLNNFSYTRKHAHCSRDRAAFEMIQKAGSHTVLVPLLSTFFLLEKPFTLFLVIKWRGE